MTYSSFPCRLIFNQSESSKLKKIILRMKKFQLASYILAVNGLEPNE